MNPVKGAQNMLSSKREYRSQEGAGGGGPQICLSNRHDGMKSNNVLCVLNENFCSLQQNCFLKHIELSRSCSTNAFSKFGVDAVPEYRNLANA